MYNFYIHEKRVKEAKEKENKIQKDKIQKAIHESKSLTNNSQLKQISLLKTIITEEIDLYLIW